MKDPIGSFESIKENFIRYVKTAFGTKFEGVEKERYDLLNYDKVLYRKPWIEPLPDYVSSGKKISDITAEDLGNALSEAEASTFKGLVNTGLVGDFPLHSHQSEMLKQALLGNNCIITSGTGSGKTESFLLPLFAQLSKELTNWQKPNQKSANINTWWQEDGGLSAREIVNSSNYTLSDAVRQRNHETRKAGVRALILYPMNALVEDQMSRLRKALDSDDTRDWLSENANGNAIYFGRYNGSSPVAGELKKIKDDGILAINTRKVNQLKEQLQQIETDSTRVEQYIQQTGKSGSDAKDLKSFFQRLDGAEMRSRFDMQVAPPDIMITNYSMLSIMLMRDIDTGIFNETKQWLEENENNIFHLIIDELHLYRGTQGTEVAYLLKLVLNRLGLHPHHPQLRILASSASLEAGDEASKNFVCDFFGVSHDHFNQKFKIIEGKNNPITAFPESGTKLPIKAFKEIAEKFSEVKGNIEDTSFISTCENAATELAAAFSIEQTENGISKLFSVITDPNFQLKERLFSPCQDYKAVCSIQANGDDINGKYFAETIFETTDSKEDLENALRGLLIARAMLDGPQFKSVADKIPDDRKLPRFRFHYFFRNIEGVWASVKADDVDTNYSDNERTTGKLYSTTRINSEKGNRVLELLYCDNCGTTLFGGSRLVTRNESGNNSFEMLPISPNIEGIPEKTPAKLVEKRSYQEYAVFWVCGNQPFTPHDAGAGISQNYWRQPTVNGFNQGDFEANWIPASLNCISGDIDNSHNKATDAETSAHWIKGYYFIITNNSNRDIALPDASGNISTIETHKALPSVCPSCGINHQKRQQRWDKSKTSSIRGFRTGFAKTTQMFAKELMYQLPSNEAERKLVVFSDSREDAAQIANGIERNHFSDLMREILVNELHSNLMFRFQIVSAFDDGNTARQQELKQQSQTIFDEIEFLVENSGYTGTNANRVREKQEAISKLNEIRLLTLNIRSLVDITNSVNLAPLVKHFVELGINPGGNDISLQTRLLNSNFVPWYDLIDFTNFQWANGADQTYINDLKEGTFSELAIMFFGSLFYSFESSALGYVCINPEIQVITDQARAVALAKDDFLQIVNSSIRILGDKYKHNKIEDADPFNFIQYSNLPEQVKKYIKAVADRFSKQEAQIGEAVFKTLSDSRLITGDKGIQIENLFIKVAQATDKVWTSQRGSRPHLHFSGGICTHSVTALQTPHSKICDDIWKENYLSYNAIKQQRPPIRLHCEELTGQTDDQFERQRHFRNIILPDEGNKQVKTIDLLSVTTTLEVGVDIGALQAVMLGNMPPQRFNYQQRVGRAGRRGQAYSVILTFCRGRSHDEFYFANPQKITGDAPPTPFLTMGQERIFKRLLAKEILRRAYVEKRIDVTSDEKSSVHGEFGSIDSWNSYKIEISDWINNNRTAIGQAVDALLTEQLKNKRDEFINWVADITTANGLIEKAQSIINNEEIATNDISEKFAEGGILPMFGMPTTVKNLYHGINRKLEPLSIDRAQAMAIYEFAPGAQKTKDKAIHQVIGFTSDFINTRRNGVQIVTNVETGNQLPFSLNRWFVRCRACGFFETYSETEKTDKETRNEFDTCPNCGEDNPDKYQRPFMLKSPRAYRTNLSAGSDTKDDSEFLLSRPPIFAEKTGTANTEIKINASISISDNDVTWRVNTNSDRFFTGKLYNTNNKFPFNQNGFWFNNQWLLNDFSGNTNDSNGHSMFVQQNATSTEEQIALASNKNTEIFRIAPSTVPLELDLNMFFSETDLPHVKAQSNGVRSGYYSAAFLLQRILADKLDVDPTEIEIADISMKILEDGTNRRIAEIILTDELPNGSGFVRFLYDNFTNLLSEAINPSTANSYLGKIHSQTHQEKCDDACYDCLKVFRNMNYHSLLDWRLGLSMLRVMSDSTFVCGADGNFNFVEVQNWLDFATELRNGFSQSFGFSNAAEINGLPIIKWGRNQRNVIMIVHPFWNMRNFTEANWLAEIYNEIKEHTESNGGKISIIDTFNLHRRPGWCYERLITR
ncbi:DEAD/DEAH box helicase [Niabella drilacis]|uniref:Helicase conserved C-terminal domain-containing protein n=1 Tax=Niabella drilacis (strain DSM 25811 / CCM 8410 / CCUG 62505 / LMG 26954 / E90) TaxID=1285928 RepID=A0A1G6JBF3_NIADE|nr:DEAD/DEAH box helicase [Niabella drilacis]SDC15967.1 Helicase conserved C-terminal domain-containing protein [Niabella drilacis]